MRVNYRFRLAAAAGAAGVVLAMGVALAPAAGAAPTGGGTSPSFIGGFKTITTVGSTVPKNGDLNPYGVAVVTRSKDRLHRGDVLVSNFNDKANTQGTGTTIVEVAPNHTVRRVRPDQRGRGCPVRVPAGSASPRPWPSSATTG